MLRMTINVFAEVEEEKQSRFHGAATALGCDISAYVPINAHGPTFIATAKSTRALKELLWYLILHENCGVDSIDVETMVLADEERP